MSSARAAERTRSIDEPNVYAFSIITCSLQNLNNRVLQHVELHPETLSKVFGGDSGKAGDEIQISIPGRPTSIGFNIAPAKSRRDEMDVLRYSETLELSVLRQSPMQSSELLHETIYVSDNADAVLDLRVPTEDLLITCEKSADLIDAHKALREGSGQGAGSLLTSPTQ